MVQHHTDSQIDATTSWVTLFDYQQRILNMHHTIDKTAHTTTFVTGVVEHWMEE